MGVASQASGFRTEVEGIALVGSPLADYLRNNRHSDLRRCLRSDIDPKWRMHCVEQLRIYSVLFYTRERRSDPTARADHADKGSRFFARKAGRLFKRGPQHLLVERVPAGYREDEAMTVEPERINRCLKWLYDYLVGRGKAFTVRKRSAVVDHRHVKTKHQAQCRKRLCDMTRYRYYHPFIAND